MQAIRLRIGVCVRRVRTMQRRVALAGLLLLDVGLENRVTCQCVRIALLLRCLLVWAEMRVLEGVLLGSLLCLVHLGRWRMRRVRRIRIGIV